MIGIVNDLAKFFKIKTVRIHDGIFVIQTKFTMIILITCCVLISTKQYFGNPIECIGDDKNKDYMNSVCWTLGTYVLNDFDREIGKNAIAEGVGNERLGTERIYLRYYQWVVLVLILQAIVFYSPYFLWKLWEGNRLQQLCGDLGSVLIPDDIYSEKRRTLLKYFTADFKDFHFIYASKYLICETLNLIICIFNILLLNIFFNEFWGNYASALSVISSYNWNEWNRRSSKVFPKMSKCDFFKYGSSGSTQHIDVLCLLPLNILYEKIFVFFWCWFLLLGLLSIINVIYRIILICCPNVRLLLIRIHARHMSKSQIRKALGNTNFGYWFMLSKVASNINPMLFRDLLGDLCEYRKIKISDESDFE